MYIYRYRYFTCVNATIPIINYRFLIFKNLSSNGKRHFERNFCSHFFSFAMEQTDPISSLYNGKPCLYRDRTTKQAPRTVSVMSVSSHSSRRFKSVQSLEGPQLQICDRSLGLQHWSGILTSVQLFLTGHGQSCIFPLQNATLTMKLWNVEVSEMIYLRNPPWVLRFQHQGISRFPLSRDDHSLGLG